MTNKEKIRAFLVGMAGADCCVTSVAKAIEKNILPYIDSLEEDAAPLTQENSTPLSGGGRAADSAQKDPLHDLGISQEQYAKAVDELVFGKEGPASKAWHDANETPVASKTKIVLYTNGRWDMFKAYEAKDDHDNYWAGVNQSLAEKGVLVKQWAYVNDLLKDKIMEKSIEKPVEGEFPYTNPSDTLDGEIENIWNKLSIDGLFTATKEGFSEVINHFAEWQKHVDMGISSDAKDTIKNLLESSEPLDTYATEVSFLMLPATLTKSYHDKNRSRISHAVRLGARWQKKKDFQDLLMSDHRAFQECYEQGKADMKEQMEANKIMRVRIEKFKYVVREMNVRKLPVLEKSSSELVEGEVVSTVVLQNNANMPAAHFVVLLDDGTFEEWPVAECVKVFKK